MYVLIMIINESISLRLSGIFVSGIVKKLGTVQWQSRLARLFFYAINMISTLIAVSFLHIKGICVWPTEPPTTTTEAPPFTTGIDPGTTAAPPGQYQSIFPHFF